MDEILAGFMGGWDFSHKTDMVSTMQISHIRLTLESTIQSYSFCLAASQILFTKFTRPLCMSLSKYCQVFGDVPISYSSRCNFGASAYVYVNEKWWEK